MRSTLSNLDEMIRESLSFVKPYASRKCTVFFSGGKDSLVVLDLVYQLCNPEVVYIRLPGNTHELCDEYVEEIAEEYSLSLSVSTSSKKEFSEKPESQESSG